MEILLGVVKVYGPEMELPAAMDFMLLQVLLAVSTGLYTTEPPSAGMITLSLASGTELVDQLEAVFQLLVTPSQVLSPASAFEGIENKKKANKTGLRRNVFTVWVSHCKFRRRVFCFSR